MVEGPTAPGKRLDLSEAPAPHPPSSNDSAQNEQIARSYSPRTAWLVVVLVVIAGLISVGVSLAYTGRRRGCSSFRRWWCRRPI